MSDQVYPGYPSSPGEPVQPAGPHGPPPSTVRNAVTLMFVRSALSALGLLALFGTKDSLKSSIRDSNPQFSGTELDSALSTAIAVGVVVALVILALYVALALQVRKGRSWARITTIVLAALSILTGINALNSPAPGLSRALGLLVLVLDIAIVALLVMRPSPDYFRHTSS